MICINIVLFLNCYYSVTAEFPKFLGIAMETLISMCDDADVDVRIVADECLNRLIRVSTMHTLLQERTNKLQIQLGLYNS